MIDSWKFCVVKWLNFFSPIMLATSFGTSTTRMNRLIRHRFYFTRWVPGG